MKKNNPNTDSTNNCQTESFTTFHKLIIQSFLFPLLQVEFDHGLGSVVFLIRAVSTLYTNEFYSESTFTGPGTNTRSNCMLHVRDSLWFKEMKKLEVKEWKNIFQLISNQKKTGVAIQIK